MTFAVSNQKEKRQTYSLTERELGLVHTGSLIGLDLDFGGHFCKAGRDVEGCLVE